MTTSGNPDRTELTMKQPRDYADRLLEIIEWDTVNWGRALSFWDEHGAVDRRQAQALEVGARHGGLSLWLAEEGADVLCTDLEGPSSKAREKHGRSAAAHLIKHASINVLDIPYRDHFDIVAFKSMLGAVGKFDNYANQVAALQQIHKCLKPGGELYFAENLVASPLHRFIRKKFVPWGKGWTYISIERMLSLLQAFSEVEYTTVGFLGAFGRDEGQRRLLGRVDRAFLDRLVPASWCYIMFGVARK